MKWSMRNSTGSNVAVQSFSLQSEAEVLGQMVGVAMRLVPPSIPSSEHEPRVPRQTELVK